MSRTVDSASSYEISPSAARAWAETRLCSELVGMIREDLAIARCCLFVLALADETARGEDQCQHRCRWSQERLIRSHGDLFEVTVHVACPEVGLRTLKTESRSLTRAGRPIS
jgi:hypothetical protein